MDVGVGVVAVTSAELVGVAVSVGVEGRAQTVEEQSAGAGSSAQRRPGRGGRQAEGGEGRRDPDEGDEAGGEQRATSRAHTAGQGLSPEQEPTDQKEPGEGGSQVQRLDRLALGPRPRQQ